MRRPTFSQENILFSQGFKIIAGLDEAGRGAWAGPIVAGAVRLTPHSLTLYEGRKFETPQYQKEKIIVRDSKLMSAQQRMRAYEFLTQNFTCAFGVVESEQIDSLGMGKANQLVMNNALDALGVRPDFALIDGRGFWFDMPYKNIIDGDAKVFCIAAASIVAKVVRDEIMKAYDNIFDEYGFFHHKGYGTRTHQEALKKHGVCPIHRMSYKPIKALASHE